MLNRFTLRGLLAATIAMSVGCPAPVQQPPPPPPPRITSFTAEPASIHAGESTQLSFAVENAKDLELLDQEGQAVTLSGNGATVSPTRTTLYVLRVSGDGGRDSAYLRVTVDDVDSVFLVAVPNEIDSGDEVSLVWSALGSISTGITLTEGSGTAVAISGASGLATVKPARSTKYTLRAEQGGGQPALTLEVAVTVRPVIVEFTATPPAALSGETLALSWRTAGADRVTLRESTFGELFTSTPSGDTGQFDFVVPTVMPGDAGTALPIGFPLEFTLVAGTDTPPQSTLRTLPSTTGSGPQILAFELPAFATEQSVVTLAWRAAAFRIELLADGQVVYAATGMAGQTGSTTFPTPSTDVVFTLVAYDANGLRVRRDRPLKVVKRPDVMVFNAPTTVFSGNNANVSWQTRDAATVTVRLKNGPVIFTTTDPGMLAGGAAQVRIGRPGELVLEAINAAGDKDVEVKVIDVTQPASSTVSPDPAAPGFDLTYAWDFTAQSPSEVHGAPLSAPIVLPGSSAFFDLTAQPRAEALAFTNVDEGLATLTPSSGFVFPFLDDTASSFWVSPNGWVSLAAPGAMPADNVDLVATTTVLPPMLAPLWDNLQLTQQSSVLWLVDGTAFPRRLTIQWNKVIAGSAPGSELTFQVQLYESGRFRFVYQRLAGATVSQGESATIGFTGGPARFRANHGFNQAVASEGLELDWFVSLVATGSFTTRAFKPGMFTPFYVTATNAMVAAPIRSRVFLPGAVVVNEAMPLSHPIVPLGRYIELHNPGTEPVDVGGLSLFVADGGLSPVVITGPRVIPPKGYFVLGESATPADNGDAPVQEAWAPGAINLVPNAQLNLRVPGVTDGGNVSQLAWGNLADGGTTPLPGVAVAADPQAVRGSPPTPLVCARGMTAFGMTGSIGTPGAKNESCYPYTVAPIAVAYEDISTTGTKLFSGPGSTDFDDKVVSINLGAPFPYFGATYSSLVIGTNGFVTVVPTTATGSANKVAPSSTNPTGTIAIFWDDLNKKATSVDGSVYTERKSNYRIVQWHHYGQFRTEGTLDDLNFQVKLFDSGAIEFHYRTMRNGGPLDRSDGSGATVWIEQPGGATALPISINAAAPRQNTAWRFTPTP